MKYKFADGKVIFAENAEEFLAKMRMSSFTLAPDDTTFMHDCAERGRKLGINLKIESAELFLESLIYYEIVAMDFPGILKRN